VGNEGAQKLDSLLNVTVFSEYLQFMQSAELKASHAWTVTNNTTCIYVYVFLLDVCE